MLTNHFTDQETDTHYIYTYTVILSRYLYSITDVKQSLFLSILEHNQEQAMFWGYELYFSGFQEETFDYLLEIARILFQIDFLKRMIFFEDIPFFYSYNHFYLN